MSSRDLWSSLEACCGFTGVWGLHRECLLQEHFPSTFSVHIYKKQSNQRMCWCSDIQIELIILYTFFPLCCYILHNSDQLFFPFPIYLLIILCLSALSILHPFFFFFTSAFLSLWSIFLHICLHFVDNYKTASRYCVLSSLFHDLWSKAVISAAISDSTLRQFHLNLFKWA